MFAGTKGKVAAGLALLSLLLLPAPLLPPHQLAQMVQSLFGVGWKTAYLVAAIGLQLLVYGSLGVVAAFSIPHASTRLGRLLQCLFVSLIVIIATVIIRSFKLGYLPPIPNAIVALSACLFGVGLGFLFRQYGWWAIFFATVIALAAPFLILRPGVSSALTRDTEVRLQQLVARGASLPAGDNRLNALWKIAFAPIPEAASRSNPIEENRAAILALGIAIGHVRLARFAGLNREDPLVLQAIALCQGATLRGREDWAQHFSISAALMVLENPFLSDAGGLLKERLDALTGGSGFSFRDLTADRAGVKFARAATDSDAAAKAMQVRLQHDFAVGDFFPPVADLPENLTIEQFRRDFGGVGSPRYRRMLDEIESRLNRCTALSPIRSGGE